MRNSPSLAPLARRCALNVLNSKPRTAPPCFGASRAMTDSTPPSSTINAGSYSSTLPSSSPPPSHFWHLSGLAGPRAPPDVTRHPVSFVCDGDRFGSGHMGHSRGTLPVWPGRLPPIPIFRECPRHHAGSRNFLGHNFCHAEFVNHKPGTGFVVKTYPGEYFLRDRFRFSCPPTKSIAKCKQDLGLLGP